VLGCQPETKSKAHAMDERFSLALTARIVPPSHSGDLFLPMSFGPRHLLAGGHWRTLRYTAGSHALFLRTSDLVLRTSDFEQHKQR
jgi:hypothetical protein